ncbi:MAG: family 16 glycoside hydrolase [Planctomycetota bacterium]|jgi:hypothetical protein
MKPTHLTPLLTLAIALLIAPATHAGEAAALIKKGELILHDDFANGAILGKMATNDERARRTAPPSDKPFVSQARVDDGVLKIVRTAGSDHAASVQRSVTFTDAVITVSYRTRGKNNFSINFNDRSDKTVHAGHLFKVQVDPHQVTIQDQKTGSMSQVYRSLRDKGKAGDKAAQKEAAAMLEGKTVTHKHQSTPNTWHELAIVVKGNALIVEIDGRRVGNHHSPGFEPTTTMIAYSVKEAADFDDLKVYKLK